MSPAILCITNQVDFLLRLADFFRLLGTGLTHQYLEHVFLFGEKNIIVTAVYRITTALAMSATFTITRYRFRFLYTDDGIRLSPHTALCHGGFLLVFVCAI